MSNEQIKKTYRDVEIIYVELSDQWNFIVNGRERNVESLVKAKESIDRALDHERKERPWKPFAAYCFRGNGGFDPVTITSQADTGRYGTSRQYWISKNGKRSKESEYYLYATTPENDRAVERWRELDAEIEKLSKEQKALVDSMARVALPEAQTTPTTR